MQHMDFSLLVVLRLSCPAAALRGNLGAPALVGTAPQGSPKDILFLNVPFFLFLRTPVPPHRHNYLRPGGLQRRFRIRLYLRNLSGPSPSSLCHASSCMSLYLCPCSTLWQLSVTSLFPFLSQLLSRSGIVSFPHVYSCCFLQSMIER